MIPSSSLATGFVWAVRSKCKTQTDHTTRHRRKTMHTVLQPSENDTVAIYNHAKTGSNLWNKHTIYYRKSAERSAFAIGKKLKNIPALFSRNREHILTANLTLSYPCSHVTQLTAKEREHMILQHIFHLIFIYLLLSEHKQKHISLKLHIKNAPLI